MGDENHDIWGEKRANEGKNVGGLFSRSPSYFRSSTITDSLAWENSKERKSLFGFTRLNLLIEIFQLLRTLNFNKVMIATFTFTHTNTDLKYELMFSTDAAKL